MTALAPVLPAAPAEWDGAMWVGELDESRLARLPGERVSLVGAESYLHARLLIRAGIEVRGFVHVPVTDGTVAVQDLVEGAAKLPPATVAPITDGGTPRVTVVICTRERPELLRLALRSVLALDYPGFDVLVVDNAPATTATQDLIRSEFADAGVRVIEEPVPGISAARNTALRAATGELVAFTDDDVVVDRLWLRALVAGFARRPDVDVVTGLVPSVELRTPTQAYFDDRVTWSRNLRPRVYTTAAPPADMPLFPFAVGVYGTGANFAGRRDRLIALGGFDTAFGAGSRTGGGEDIDLFFRILQAGRSLAVEPGAIVWHRHRSDLAALRKQSWGYGVGLGAWLTKICLEPATLLAALRVAPAGLARLVGPRTAGSADESDPGVPPFVASGDLARAVAGSRWYELRCVALGPLLFLRQRWNREGHGFPEGPASQHRKAFS